VSELEKEGGSLNDELSKLEVHLRAGFFEGITVDSFPRIFEQYPEFAISVQLGALGNRVSNLHSALRNSPDHEKSDKLLLERYAKTRSLMLEISTGEPVSESEELPGPLAFFTNEEREQLRIYEEIGDHSLVNSVNLPGLKFVNPQVVGEIQSAIVQKRIDRLSALSSGMKQGPTFQGEG